MFLRNFQQDTPPALNCHTPDLTITRSLPASNQMAYQNELYGIGPQLGTSLYWDMFQHFAMGGNIIAGLIFGNQHAKLTDYGQSYVTFPTTANEPKYFAQVQSSIWASILLSGQVYVSYNHYYNNNGYKVLRLDGGVSGDVYISNYPVNYFDSTGNVSFGNNFFFRDIFIRLVYKA